MVNSKSADSDLENESQFQLTFELSRIDLNIDKRSIKVLCIGGWYVAIIIFISFHRKVEYRPVLLG